MAKKAKKSAKSNGLASLSVEALFKLRDEVGEILSSKASELRRQLARLTGVTPKRGRPAGKRKGAKVAPKYRGPDGELWSGRGMKPRWMVAALKKGKKIDDFAIKKAA